jgi:hypothetical protein
MDTVRLRVARAMRTRGPGGRCIARGAAKLATGVAQRMRLAIGQMRIIADFPSCYYRSMCHNRNAFL